MAEEFGARLRRERERRKISLESIAANTKVSLSLFQDLERDDASRWPSGIFRRSFIRSYATAIGLDAEAVVREFLERFPDPADAVPEGSAGATHDRPGLRLTLADAGLPFKGGPVLNGRWLRLLAVSLDAGVVLVTGALLFLGLGAFWMPTALFTVGYYWAGILLLGNTPGVCLLAPAQRDNSRSPTEGRRGQAGWTEMLQAASGVWRRWSDAGSRRSISSSPSVSPPDNRTLSKAG
jgi:transcriptional regulator with XRE-family HTH domain